MPLLRPLPVAVFPESVLFVMLTVPVPKIPPPEATVVLLATVELVIVMEAFP